MQKFPALLLLGVLISCSSSNDLPSGVLDINKMKPVLWDLFRADGLSELQLTKIDSAAMFRKKTELYQQVFAIHGITHDQFYKSYEYYQQHPDKNRILLDSVMQYAHRERQSLFQKTP